MSENRLNLVRIIFVKAFAPDEILADVTDYLLPEDDIYYAAFVVDLKLHPESLAKTFPPQHCFSSYFCPESPEYTWKFFLPNLMKVLVENEPIGHYLTQGLNSSKELRVHAVRRTTLNEI